MASEQEADRITQEYMRRWPDSRRAKSWAGRMVHIQTENGVWRTNGYGYTWAHKPDAWVLPFEEAQKCVAHCGPEKQATFIAARPAPAATDTGLVTAAWQRKHPTAGWMDCGEEYIPHYRDHGQEVRELSPRSQAEELLAAERAEIRRLQRVETELCTSIGLLEADNAEKEARIKELAQINANLMGDDEDKPRYTTKRLKHEIARATEALEVKLAAAEQAARVAHETLIEINPSNYNHDDVCQLNDASVEAIFLLADILGETHGKTKEWWDERRAVLGGKPS